MENDSERTLSGADTLFLSRMFSDPSDRDSRAWFLEDVAFDRLAKLPEELHFGGVKAYVFNQFRNRQPHVYNYNYLFLGRNNVHFMHRRFAIQILQACSIAASVNRTD
jgi:hypothetical protein